MLKINVKFDPDAVKRKIEAQGGVVIQQAVSVLHDTVLELTPVNSGKTVANWNASKDTPLSTDKPGVSVGIPATSGVPLGGEANRDGATRVARQTRYAIDFVNRPFARYFVANGSTVDDNIAKSELAGENRAVLIEYGTIPNTNLGTLIPATPRIIGPLRLAAMATRVWSRTRNR